MLQITPQMKILVAVESADFRKGIDGLVRHCKDTLGQDPFDQIRQALEACESSNDVEIVPMDSFELECLIGDVSRSINQMKSGATQNQPLDLCDRLEAAESYGDGTLDSF